MSVGYSVDQPSVNNKAGQLISQLWQVLRDIREFNSWLNDSTHTDSFLLGLGFAQVDINALRAAISDLGSDAGLYGVAHAISHPAGNNDFFFNAKKLTGTTWAG